LAGSLGMTVEKLQQALYDASATTMSLNRMVDADAMDRSAQVMPEFADDKAVDPLGYSERMELSQQLSRCIGQLTQREQQVLSLYYVDELNLREIGQVLQVSESRVCQLHTKAIMRLRGLLAQEVGDAPVPTPTPEPPASHPKRARVVSPAAPLVAEAL
ncbi:MAG TPA: sigma-70 family RNA polymerase sigma factor, partial [Chloroflexota bacterium]|nr:sigma-70 family RNA polymerase sigma factor [Chloroflexota bacterium]